MDQPQPIRVLFIINPVRGAGADMSLLEVARGLDPGRYHLIIGLLTDAPEADSLIPPGTETVRFHLTGLNGWHWLPFTCKLLYFLWRRPVHILHVNSYIPGNFARLAALLMGVPIIIDHWRGLLRFNPKRRFICRALGRFTELSLAISKSVRDHVLSECRLDPERFKVSYIGVDPARFQQLNPAAEVRRELGLSGEVPLVALVARMDNWAKGHKELFAALRLLAPSHQLQALVIGSGRREAEIRALAREVGVSETVHFLGNRADVPDLLNAVDLYVNPSYTEGFSRSLLEAMAASRPVIASRVGGMAEVVRDGDNGLLVPPQDPAALAQALARLLDDPDFAKKLGDRAREDVEANYTLERLYREINEMYGELVEKKMGLPSTD